jgi:hypothetical protein
MELKKEEDDLQRCRQIEIEILNEEEQEKTIIEKTSRKKAMTTDLYSDEDEQIQRVDQEGFDEIDFDQAISCSQSSSQERTKKITSSQKSDEFALGLALEEYDDDANASCSGDEEELVIPHASKRSNHSLSSFSQQSASQESKRSTMKNMVMKSVVSAKRLRVDVDGRDASDEIISNKNNKSKENKTKPVVEEEEEEEEDIFAGLDKLSVKRKYKL